MWKFDTELWTVGGSSVAVALIGWIFWVLQSCKEDDPLETCAPKMLDWNFEEFKLTHEAYIHKMKSTVSKKTIVSSANQYRRRNVEYGTR